MDQIPEVKERVVGAAGGDGVAVQRSGARAGEAPGVGPQHAHWGSRRRWRPPRLPAPQSAPPGLTFKSLFLDPLLKLWRMKNCKLGSTCPGSAICIKTTCSEMRRYVSTSKRWHPKG